MTVRFARPSVNPSWALAALLALAVAPVARAEEPAPRTVSTTGSATVYVTPDRVDLRFSVQTFDADLAKAKTLNDESAGKVLAFLKTTGVEDKLISTQFASADPVYPDERRENGRLVRGPLSGYTVSRSYGVRLDDVAKFPAVLDRLLTDTAVSIEGHTFSSKADRDHRDRARRDATIAAREKAQLLANTLEARLGSVRTIAESPAAMPYGLRLSNSFAGGGDGPGGLEDATPIGQIEIRAEVSVTFDLTPRE